MGVTSHCHGRTVWMVHNVINTDSCANNDGFAKANIWVIVNAGLIRHGILYFNDLESIKQINHKCKSCPHLSQNLALDACPNLPHFGQVMGCSCGRMVRDSSAVKIPVGTAMME